MRKKVLGFVIAISALSAGMMFAQSNSQNQAPANKEYSKSDKGMKKGQRAPYNPFDGVQLTTDQQEKLKVLREGLGPVKLDKQQMQNLTDEQKKQMKKEAKAKKAENKKKYLDGVKGILTPDQYVVFLENVYLYGPEPSNKGNMKFEKKGDRKGNKDHKGKKSSKGDKQRKADKEKKN